MSESCHYWKFVIRRVNDKPQFFHSDGTVSSALFKDSKGVSVDKDHYRLIEEIVSDEERLNEYYNDIAVKEGKQKNKLKALVTIDKIVCDSLSIFVKDDPIPEINIHHCLLLKNNEEISLSNRQAKELAMASVCIKKY